jgi:hypothetical protein
MVPMVKIERTIEGRDHGFIRPPGGTFRSAQPLGDRSHSSDPWERTASLPTLRAHDHPQTGVQASRGPALPPSSQKQKLEFVVRLLTPDGNEHTST